MGVLLSKRPHTHTRAHTAASCFLNSPARSVAHSRRESTQSQNKLVGAHRESTSKRDLMKSESFDQSPMASRPDQCSMNCSHSLTVNSLQKKKHRMDGWRES